MQTWLEIVDYLKTFIPEERAQKFSGNWGLDRAKRLLHYLDNPQEKIQVIHIAGTSGKGSTAFLVANILKSQNQKVGLHISPYLVDLKEVFQIDLEFVEEKVLLQVFTIFQQAILKLQKNDKQTPTFYEILASFSYFLFWHQKVDFAVMEVGLGGLFDCTNTVSNPNKVCGLNLIGFDHQKILGNTIEKISTQKAGIIQPKNTVFAIEQEYDQAKEIFIKTAGQKQAKIEFVKESQNFILQKVNQDFTEFTYKKNLELDFKNSLQTKEKSEFIKIQLGLLGDFQAKNCSLALRICEFVLTQKNLEINWLNIQKSLKNAKLKGRIDLYKFQKQTLILDGAHNPQKMQAFINSLNMIFTSQKFVFLVAFLDNKEVLEMLKILDSKAKQIIFTTFDLDTQATSRSSLNLDKIKGILPQQILIKSRFVKDQNEALEKALNLKENLVVTGSLYFLGQIYKNTKIDKNLKL